MSHLASGPRGPTAGAANVASRCLACGGELFRFAPPPSARSIDLAALPTACRQCRQICVGNEPVSLPPATVHVATETARQGRLARERLLADPTLRIERYFGEDSRTGFLHGVFRAMSFFPHHTKEGRLRRLRTLWKHAERRATTDVVEIRMAAPAFLEFRRLLDVASNERGCDAANPAHADSAG